MITYTRRWLLDGTSIGTGVTVVPVIAGTLVLEVTATDSDTGKSVVALSNGVNVTAETLKPVVQFTKLAAEGDSITYHVASYANQWAGAHSSAPFSNFSQSGARVGARGDATGDNTLWGRIASVISYAPSHLSILMGANDLNSKTAAQWLADLYDYVTEIKKSLPNLVVLVSTVLPASASLGTGYVYHNDRRHTVNAQLRLDAGTKFDALIPMGDDPLSMYDAAADDQVYFPDGLHPSGVGRARMTLIYSAVMNSVIANAIATSPSSTLR